MRYLFLLLAAPLGFALAQPAQSVQKPAGKAAAVEAHVARHPKTKVSTVRVKKREEPSKNRAAARPVTDSASSVVVPLPTMHRRAKTPRKSPPR